MALLSDYTSGTISVAANGTAVTGVGTGWAAAGFQEGDLLFANGYSGVVLSVGSNTALTLAQPWRGGALSGAAYRLRYQSDGSRFSAQARALIEMIGGSGNLEALGGLQGAANMLAYFTGAGQMGLTEFPGASRALLASPASLPTETNMVPVFTGPETAELKALGEEFLTANGFSTFMAGLRDKADAGTLLTALEFSEFMAGLRGVADGPALYGAMGQIPNAQVRNDLTADKAYRRGNVRGTVSQTGGVPTGALIESGSNANGQYARFADGTQICSLVTDRTAEAWTQAVSIFYRPSSGAGWVFPAAFSSSPALQGCGSAVSSPIIIEFYGTVTNTGVTITPYATSPLNAGVSKFVRLMAIGRWF